MKGRAARGGGRKPLQALPKLLRRAPFPLVKGAGPEDQRLQLRVAVFRRLQRLAPQPAAQSLVRQIRRHHGGGQGDKGQPPLIEQIIQGQAQGIHVRLRAIGLLVADLRSHKGADAGAYPRPAPDLLIESGNAEIPEHIGTRRIDEDILGLDIPMEQLLGAAKHQSAGNIPADAEYGIRKAAGSGALHGRHQGGEQLHLDEHVPADAVRMPVIPHLVAADDVRMVLHLGQVGVFLHDALEIVLIAPGDGGPVVPLPEQPGDILFLTGDGDEFQRGLFHAPGADLLDLIDRSVVALADQPYRFPSRPFDPAVYC